MILLTASSISEALGGHKTGSGFLARCPAHDDRKPSLSVRQTDGGRILVHCHAGCDQAAVIEALRARGLWQGYGSHNLARAARPIDPGDRHKRDGAERTRAALDIWRASRPASRTPVVNYLRTRGLNLHLPPTLRFHTGLRHPAGGFWPAMVALVTRGPDNAPLGIHRSFLGRDGSGKAPVKPTRMMLGPCGGGAVRLAEPGDGLMIGEGLETCLTAMQATGRPAWAALSTSGLRALDLPDEIRDVTVLADGDDPGEAAALDCAMRWKREGRNVRIARPLRGLDFNDLLLGDTPGFEGSAG